MRLQRSWEMSKCNEMQLELMLLSRPWPSGVFFIVHICNAIRVWRKNTKEGMKFAPYRQGRRNKTFLGKPKASLTLFGAKVGEIFFPFVLFRLDFVSSNCQIKTFETFLGWKLTSIGIFWHPVHPIETYNSYS